MKSKRIRLNGFLFVLEDFKRCLPQPMQLDNISHKLDAIAVQLIEMS
jgi:hypothetical protein